MSGTAPVLQSLGLEPSANRQVYLLPFKALAEIPESLSLPGPRFVLLLAGDFGNPSEDLASIARRIVHAGCAYFCAWGPGCVLMHDEVDEAGLTVQLDEDDDDSVLMTTWHEDESLGDAVCFAVVTAMPVGIYATGCDATILAVSDRGDWLRDAERAASEYLVQHAI